MPTVIINRAADKALQKLPLPERRSILTVFQMLAATPFPKQAKKLKGIKHAYRVRVREYRILYTYNPALQKIEIYRIAHRKEVYRG